MQHSADSMFILADDLSGAADCAIGAAKAGLKSVVVFDGAPRVQAQVLAVDADSRHVAPALARAINAALWLSGAAPRCLFYKKIDSTLRGNFAAEMTALTGAGVAIVAPAFPATGRTTRNARVLIDGVALERTEIWANEGMTGEADVVAMLSAQGLAACSVGLPMVRGDLRAELARRVAGARVQAIVCDAETDADLAAVAAASVGLPVYWVGSAGLAAHLPRAAGIEGHAESPGLVVAGPILTVVGSLSALSREQARTLETQADIASIVAAPQVLRTGEAHPMWQPLRESAAAALGAGRDLMIRTGREEHNDLAHGRAICESMARLLAPLMAGVGALVATGGETARALLSASGVHGLQVLREIESGVPLSVTLGPRPIPVVTKAGAFGSPAALLDAYHVLAGIRRRGRGA
jgi:uncharacterized protein YgbK (DUF1537 family)